MKRCALCANYAIKTLALLGSLACYILLFGFWKSLESKHPRIILSLIFPGYSLVCIAIALAVYCGSEVNRRLNRVISMCGVAAYWGAAAVCWLHVELEKKELGQIYCLAAGGTAVFQALVLTADFFSLLGRPETRPKTVKQTLAKASSATNRAETVVVVKSESSSRLQKVQFEGTSPVQKAPLPKTAESLKTPK